MTGTEEQAAQELLALIRSGTPYSEAVEEVRSAYNLTTLSVSVIVNAVADHI